jgi:hypothetical protein
MVVAASFAAFGITQRLKHTPAAVQRFEMTPSFAPTRIPAAACRGRVPRRLIVARNRRLEYLSFKLAQADAVTVAIVDSAGDEVAGIARDLPVARYKQLSLCWNGHRGPTQSGGLAAGGEYRVRVSLRRQGLTRYSPRGFVLQRGAP